MLNQALIFLVDTLLGLFSLALLLRFYLQLMRAPYRNPVSQFLNALTDFVVRPARRVIPGLWGADLATLGLAWTAELVLQLLILLLKGHSLAAAPGVAFVGLALLAAVKVLKVLVWIVIVAVIVQAVLSWVNPYSPVAPLLEAMTGAFLRPFRRRIPLVGGVDLSPLFLIIACQLVLMVPIAWLELTVSQIF